MSVHQPVEDEARQELKDLYDKVRSASFKARTMPTVNRAVKDHTRHVEYMLILIENDLREMYGELFPKEKED